MEEIQISTEFIRLDALLKLTGLVDTGGQAKAAIQQGLVRVNGGPCLMRGKKMRPGDTLTAGGRSFLVAGAERPGPGPGETGGTATHTKTK